MTGCRLTLSFVLPRLEIRALSIQRSRLQYAASLGAAPFQLTRLHLDLDVTWHEPGSRQKPSLGPGLPQLLSSQCLPHLRFLRLSCEELPLLDRSFVDNLQAVQIDFRSFGKMHLSESAVWQISPSSTPILYSCPCPVHGWYTWLATMPVRYLRIRAEGRNALTGLSLFTSLEAISIKIDSAEVLPQDLFEQPITSCKNEIGALLQRHNVDLFTYGDEDEDFVNSGFMEYLRRNRA